MKYVPENKMTVYTTNFSDNILSAEWNKAELENDDLKNYRAKAEYYIRERRTMLQSQSLKRISR